MPVKREIVRGQMVKRLNGDLRAAPGLYPGVHVGSTLFSSSCFHHQSTAALLINENHPQYWVEFVHIQSPDVLFPSLGRDFYVISISKVKKKGKKHFFIITGV